MIVNESPTRAAQVSISHVGANAHASVCTIGCARGPGGRAAVAEPSAAGGADERDCSARAIPDAAPSPAAVVALAEAITARRYYARARACV